MLNRKICTRLQLAVDMDPTRRTMQNSQTHTAIRHVASRITSEGEGKCTRRFELGGSDELSRASEIEREGYCAPRAGLFRLYLTRMMSRRPGCL